MKDIKKYFIAGFDVLGYSNRVRECDKDLFGIISDSVSFVKEELSQKYDFQFKIFSDNFSLYSEHNCEGVLLATALMQAKLACSGVFTRGVLLHDDLIITDDFVYGESIIRANEVETKVAKYPRIIIDKPLTAYLQSIKNGLEILDSYFIEDNDGWFYIDYLEMLKFANKDAQNIEIKHGDMSKKIPLSFSDELDAHRHYIEEELAKHKNKIESAMLSSNFDDIKKHNEIKEKFIWVMKYHNQFCIKYGYYQHLIVGNIRGKMLRFSDDEIGNLDCQFQINLSERRFCIVITAPEIIDNGFIHKLHWNETTLKSDCVFGEDTETDLKFTLCSCQIGINRLNQKSPNKDGRFYIESAEICVFWESIIIGQHIPCIDDLGITEMFVLAESRRPLFSHVVSKICYKIENNSIDVNVDFFEIKRKLFESWNIARKGCLFGLKPLQSIALRDMKESYKRLLDLYYLMVGYYPDNTRFWCNSESGNFIHISHTDGFIKSKNKDMILERNLYCSNRRFHQLNISSKLPIKKV